MVAIIVDLHYALVLISKRLYLDMTDPLARPPDYLQIILEGPGVIDERPISMRPGSNPSRALLPQGEVLVVTPTYLVCKRAE